MDRQPLNVNEPDARDVLVPSDRLDEPPVESHLCGAILNLPWHLGPDVEVIDKHENPTWHNPAPDTWGADMPLMIPGGPSNPLGTRALYLDAPGIRIHGTPDTDSVGFYVSHGCIRMRMWEVEELYPRVPIGTPMLICGSPPWGTVENPGTPGT